jgi:translation initiation factor IF-3
MKRHRINGQIHATQVRVVDDEGKEIGVLAVSDALKLVAERREDLVEIQPDAVPPLCQAIDYGKFRYRQLQEEKKRWS